MLLLKAFRFFKFPDIYIILMASDCRIRVEIIIKICMIGYLSNKASLLPNITIDLHFKKAVGHCVLGKRNDENYVGKSYDIRSILNIH